MIWILIGMVFLVSVLLGFVLWAFYLDVEKDDDRRDKD